MIRTRDTFNQCCRRLALAYMKLAGADELPSTETMVNFSDIADDLTAYVSCQHANVANINGGPRLIRSNVVRLDERRAR